MFLNEGSLDGNRVLQADTVALMAQNHIGDLNVRRLPSAIPHVSNAIDFYPEQDKKWGLGFMINTEQTAQGRSAGSLAWGGLANTYFWLDPKRKVGGVLLAQLFPFADEKVLNLFGGFERAIYETLGKTNARPEPRREAAAGARSRRSAPAWRAPGGSAPPGSARREAAS